MIITCDNKHLHAYVLRAHVKRLSEDNLNIFKKALICAHAADTRNQAVKGLLRLKTISMHVRMYRTHM